MEHIILALRRTTSIGLTGLLATAAVTLTPAAALARPVMWGGTGANDVGPATLLLSTEGGRAGIRSLQATMACTDTSDGTESDRAYSIVGRGTVALRLNHFSFTFNASSGGRDGHVRLTGVLGSNGRGTATLTLTATGRDRGTGAIIERCQATVPYRLRRGA